MSRRKKKSRPKQAKAQSREEAVRAAAEHLESGRFKDAAADYKRLLKEEQRPEWIDGLAQAYAGRAAHLAARGMSKEAIALWQNRAEACGAPLADPRYLEWLLAAERTQEIVRLYRQDAAALAGEDGLAGLRARLAAAALADGGELVGQLPADDPVARDFDAADTALAAYARGDDASLDAALARIAFRSPYRDFRQLLKALQRYEQGEATGAERLPADTPFAGLRAALAAAGQTGSWPDIAALSADVLAVIAALAGWDSQQWQQTRALARLGSSPSDKALFDFVMTRQKVLGQPFAREAAFALAGTDTRMQHRLIRVTGALPRAEKARLVARVMEAHDAPGDAINQWLVVLEELCSDPDHDDNRLRCALIHRHIADLIQPPQASLPLAPEIVDHLESSLEFDAEDRDSYRRLIAHYLHVRELKGARKWVDRALQQFPNDRQCLFDAAQTAVIGQSFKKAASFAQHILAVDPINSRARGLLVDAYLGHARKQIKANKTEAARRELERADQWARGAVDAGRIQILHGLVALTAKDVQAAGEALNKGLASAGGGLTGRFYLLLEAGRIGQNLAAVTRAANLPAVKKTGDREQVLALAHALGALRDGQYYAPAVEAALDKLAPAIDQAAQPDLSREQAELVCETLLRYRQYRSLTRYAQAALKNWRQAPLFVFFWTQGQLKGRLPAPWSYDTQRLRVAYERANEAGDTRTAQRIQAVLDAALPPLPRFNDSSPFVDDDDEPAGHRQLGPALRAIFETILSPSEMHRLEEALRRNQPPPPDVAAKIEAFLGESDAKPEPKRRSGKPKKPAAKTNPAQDDLFGEPE